MPTYTKCDAEVVEIASKLIGDHYSDLKECEVSFTYLFAYAPRDKNGEPKGDALKSGSGMALLAKVERTSLKNRVLGESDVTMLIDGDKWKNLQDNMKVALIDHELYHVLVKRDKDGHVVSDDIGRPVIKMRPHDWEITGFKAIAERYGDASVEVCNASDFKNRFGDVVFGAK